MGFCESSDFSSLGVSAYDFSDYFSNVLAPPVSFTSEPDRLDHGGFSFRHVNADACLLVFMSITSRFLRVLLPFIFHVFNLAIISSVFPSAWKKVIVRRVCLIFDRLQLCLLCLRALNICFMSRFWVTLRGWASCRTLNRGLGVVTVLRRRIGMEGYGSRYGTLDCRSFEI
jgi:hypothetical protein